MTGLAGEVLLRGGAPQNTLKSVQLAGGEEITDTPHAFKNGESVTIVLTSQASTVEGTVTDATGKPVTDAAVVMFSDDKNAWRSNSVRTRRTSADVNGHFRMQGVLPGRYYLIAMPRDRMNGITLGIDPSAFEALSKEATSVVVGQDEQRQIDIKLSSGGGL
jgi:protocatechuate 3,4-dioxygenase beta subunit